jgi:hypothetical protein
MGISQMPVRIQVEMVMDDKERKRMRDTRFYSEYPEEAGEIADVIEQSDEKMYIAFDGTSVYILSDRPTEVIVRIDSLDGTSFRELGNYEKIREHIRERLREGGLGDITV